MQIIVCFFFLASAERLATILMFIGHLRRLKALANS